MIDTTDSEVSVSDAATKEMKEHQPSSPTPSKLFCKANRFAAARNKTL